jgi:hypothetical protein
MTPVTDTPTSSVTAVRFAGFVVLVAGLVCLVTLALSDGFGPRSFPPDGSLYTPQNWLQGAAILVCGVLLVIPGSTVGTRWAASGVSLASSGLLFGSAIVAVKHWRPYGGMAIGYVRTHEMEVLSGIAGAAALIAAVASLIALSRSRAFPVAVSRVGRTFALVGGAVMIVVIPPLVGMGSSEDMDARSLGAFALIYGLPWGVALALTGFMNPLAAVAIHFTVAASAALTIVLHPMPDLVFGSAVPAGVVGLAITSLALFIRLRDGESE